ncbi:hypothetical protein [Tolypothrix sp. VBCCA 56010]|uniref:hypothetical protein n=1 Tax=Tolypothrix sp. VBCCA 56010 TaxID=3137731 RepID=UPI003D7EC808
MGNGEWGVGNGEWVIGQGGRGAGGEIFLLSYRCPMPYALCPMPYALCPITNYPIQNQHVSYIHN